MGLLEWIQDTSVAEYIAVSAYGYPAMITLHSFGLAVMVGLSVVLSLRVLGAFSAIPFSSLQKLLPVAWVGFIVNFISGSLLFAANATGLFPNKMFLLKMLMVIVGAILVGVMQAQIKTALAGGGGIQTAPMNLKILAWAVIAAWTIGMVSGRLIAYINWT